ncbi:MAG: V-type ATP synthase subunit I [Oscillospiraceae bacterium]|nr:V-type ATP synthase subunit I [Oscillospiraceae bacterium]
MAIVKMKKLRAIALAGQRDELLRELMLLGCVELTSQDAGDAEGRASPDHGPLTETQAERQLYREAIGVLNEHVPQKSGLLTPRPSISTAALMDEKGADQTEGAAKELIALRERLKTLASDETREKLRLESLAPWRSCELPLDHPGTRYTAVSFGMVPLSNSIDALSAALLNDIGAAELFEVSADDSARYVYVVYLRSEAAEVMKLLREHGFTVPAFGDASGTAAEGVAEAEKRLADISAERSRTEARIAELSSHRAELQRLCDLSETKVERAEATGKLLRMQSALLLEGWTPAEREGDVTALLERFSCAYEFEDPAPEEYEDVPVTLKNGKITRSLNTVTNMYSLPAYNGVDPNPLMAPFFIFFYGMMMADMGYGLLMILGCLVVLKVKKPSNPHFWELFLWCGIATFAWGIFTASFFGDAATQIYLLFHPGVTLPENYMIWFWQPLIIPTSHALPLLIGSLALGVIQIFTGMAVSIYMKVKRGEVMSALTDEVAWYLIFILAAIGILCNCLLPMVIVICVILIVAGAYGKRGFGIFTGIFGGIYSHVTGYFSDILSYSRLMALMLAGAVIAQVFNQLGGITGNIIGFLIISIVGNALNMGLNLLGCYVHDMRLQCLEFFGRFYVDGGKPFAPLSIRTNYVDVKKS